MRLLSCFDKKKKKKTQYKGCYVRPWVQMGSFSDRKLLAGHRQTLGFKLLCSEEKTFCTWVLTDMSNRAMLKKVKKQNLDQSLDQIRKKKLMESKTHPPSKFCGDLFSSFCIILLTIQQEFSKTTSWKTLREAAESITSSVLITKSRLYTHHLIHVHRKILIIATLIQLVYFIILSLKIQPHLSSSRFSHILSVCSWPLRDLWVQHSRRECYFILDTVEGITLPHIEIMCDPVTAALMFRSQHWISESNDIPEVVLLCCHMTT